MMGFHKELFESFTFSKTNLTFAEKQQTSPATHERKAAFNSCTADKISLAVAVTFRHC